MKILNPYDDNDEYFPKIISAKDELIRTPLEENIQSILEFYGFYRKNTQFLEQMKQDETITDEFKKCLLACYNKPTSKLEELKQKIKTLQGDYTFCPYCGINTCDSFDHYLPKKIFPQYCVFPLNLIPACTQCNRIKGERFTKNGNRLFINPYFDSFLKKQFLAVNLEFDDIADSIPTVEFVINDSELNSGELKIANSHLKILNLYNRYLKEATLEVSEIHRFYVKINSHNPLAVEQLTLLLISEAEILKESRGSNNWKAILRETLGYSDKFLALCSRG